MRPGPPHRSHLEPALLALVMAAAACTAPNPAFVTGEIAEGGADAIDGTQDLPGEPPALDGEPAPVDGEPPDAEPDAAPLPDAEPPPDATEQDLPSPADLATEETTPPDTSPPPPDVAPEAAADLRPPVSCGSARPPLTDLDRGDGLAVAPDGTMYFTSDDGTHAWIGRRTGTTVTREWLRINFARLTAGLALDRAGTNLYVASVSGEALLVFDLAANPVVGSTVIDGVAGINDLAIAPDGSTVYFSRQSDRHVYLVRAGANAAVRVTTSTIGVTALDQAPAGLAFGPDGALYVGQRNGGNILRLTLAGDGREAGRSNFGTFTGWANGLAFDLSGRLYVAIFSTDANTKVVRLAAGGGADADLETGAQFSSLAFGRGSLDCRDLYMAVPSGAMRRRNVDIAGFFVAP